MLQVKYRETAKLKPYKRNARTHSANQINLIMRSLKVFGFNNPIIIDDDDGVIAGHGRLTAAIQLGMQKVPTIRLSHMNEQEKQAYILADNKLAEKAGWDHEILKIELQEIQSVDVQFDLTLSGFETPEIDFILNSENDLINKEIDTISSEVSSRVRRGEIWKLGEHLFHCGNSLETQAYEILLGGKKADLIFADPPYNVKVNGHVSGRGRIKHTEFAYASGEMTEEAFQKFLSNTFELLVANSKNGSIHFICMDWRHVREITMASLKHYSELKNICVWNKPAGWGVCIVPNMNSYSFSKTGTPPILTI